MRAPYNYIYIHVQVTLSSGIAKLYMKFSFLLFKLKHGTSVTRIIIDPLYLLLLQVI